MASSPDKPFDAKNLSQILAVLVMLSAFAYLIFFR